MPEPTRSPLATIKIVFHDDGDATFMFDVDKNVNRPTMSNLATIGFAKLVSEMVGSLIGSPAMPQISQMLEAVMLTPDDDDA